MRDPLAPHEAPVELSIRARRYQCTNCGAVLVVVPCGVAVRRLFTIGAILLALHLWAVEGLPAREARRQVSPHRHLGAIAGWGWSSLRRWALAGAQAAIARRLRPIRRAEGEAVRALAAHVVHAASAFAPPGLRSEGARERVFAAGALAA